MKRGLTQFLFALGLLLTLAAGAVYFRGIWASDWFAVTWRRIDGNSHVEAEWMLFTSRTQCAIYWSRQTERIDRPEATRPAAGFRTEHQSIGPGANITAVGGFWQRLGFMIESTGGAGPAEWGRVAQVERFATARTWFVALVGTALIAFPARFLRRDRHARMRHERGQCVTCAYDLRGAAHDRCPECGETVAAAAARV